MTDTVAALTEGKTEPPGWFRRVGWALLALGVLLFTGSYALDPQRSAMNHIITFLFLASIAGGALFLIAIEYIAGAVWSVPMRRVAEFLSALTPLLVIVGLPLIFQIHDVFHWAHNGGESDPLLAGKAPYLNVTFFAGRFFTTCVLWSLFYFLFTRNSTRQDERKDPRLTTWNIRLSAIFLPVFAITLSVTAIDWAMSLEPHWYSTIFGVYYFSGTVLAGVAAVTFLVVDLHARGSMPFLRRDHFYSLGALLFAFINFWAYIAFSQFMLIWYANLPEETGWFISRWKGGWEFYSVGLILLQFAVPYFALLSQNSKMDLRRLRVMALWILAAHYVDLYWLVMPTHSPALSLSWMDLAGPVFSGGIVLLVVAFGMRRRNLLPVGDPKLERGLHFRL